MFIYTMNEETKKKLDEKFKFIYSINLKKETFYIYEFNKKYFSLFSKDETVFITNKLFFLERR